MTHGFLNLRVLKKPLPQPAKTRTPATGTGLSEIPQGYPWYSLVGGHVKGSLTRKKYMGNEIWSLISF